MIYDVVFQCCKMSYRKIYSYDDIDNFAKEHRKFIIDLYKELNKDIIITHPTEQQFEKLLYEILEKVTNIRRCAGVYVSGKNKNKRCHAFSHLNSEYCLNHIGQGLQNKQLHETDPRILELIKKNENLNPEDFEKALESFKKSKLNDQ
jgi:hypothetical protein